MPLQAASVTQDAGTTLVGVPGSMANHLTASAGFSSSWQLRKMVCERLAGKIVQSGRGDEARLCVATFEPNERRCIPFFATDANPAIN